MLFDLSTRHSESRYPNPTIRSDSVVCGSSVSAQKFSVISPKEPSRSMCMRKHVLRPSVIKNRQLNQDDLIPSGSGKGMQLLLILFFLVGNGFGQIGRFVSHLLEISIVHVENPRVVLLGLMLVNLAF